LSVSLNRVPHVEHSWMLIGITWSPA
jgi:hypothetical protein